MNEKSALLAFVAKGKIPHYDRRHGKTTISTVLDDEGLHTIIYGSVDFNHQLKPIDEVTDEDCLLLYDKIMELTK